MYMLPILFFFIFILTKIIAPYDSRFSEGKYVAVKNKKAAKLLIDKKMSQSELRKEAGIAPNTMTKMRRDEAVNLAILGRICDVLHCDFGDIMEHKCMNDDKGEV